MAMFMLLVVSQNNFHVYLMQSRSLAYICDYRWGFGLDIGFIDHFQVVNTNTCNTIAISTLYEITLFSSPQCLH
jgi:hypothetical protein